MADNETNPAEDASASENTPHAVAYPERFCFEEGYYETKFLQSLSDLGVKQNRTVADKTLPVVVKGERMFKQVDDNNNVSEIQVPHCDITTNCTSVMCLFVERGIWSNQLYQPVMNHRDLQFSSFLTATPQESGTQTYPPLMQSLGSLDGKHGFTKVTPICLFPYEIFIVNTDNENTTDDTLMSLRTLGRVNMTPPGSNKSTSLTGTLAGVRARALSKASFLRTCELFGITVDMGEREAVSAADVGEFMRHFDGYNTSSREELNRFLHDFGIESLVTMEEEATLDVLVQRIGWALRGIVPFRLGSPEGQHRLSLCCFASTGFFAPRSVAPLHPVPMEECPIKPMWPEGIKFESLQLFSPLRLQIINPVISNRTFRQCVRQILRYLGEEMTSAQSINIEQRFEVRFKALLNRIQAKIANNKDEEHIDNRIGFNSFWNKKNDKFEMAGQVAKTVIQNYMMRGEGKQYWAGRSIKPLFQQLSAISSTLEHTNKTPWAAGDDNKTMNKRIVHALFLVKATMFSAEAMDNIEKFFNGVESEYTQGLIPMDKGPFQTISWIEDMVMPVVRDVAEAYLTKIGYEVRFLHFLRKCIPSDHEISEYDLKITQDFWKQHTDFSRTTYWKAYTPTLPRDPDDANKKTKKKGGPKSIAMGNSAMSIGKTSLEGYATIVNTIKFAAYSTIFNDIIATIVKYGFDPLIPTDRTETDNAFAWLYLYQTLPGKADKAPVTRKLRNIYEQLGIEKIKEMSKYGVKSGAFQKGPRPSIELLLYLWKDEAIKRIGEPETARFDFLYPFLGSCDFTPGGSKDLKSLGGIQMKCFSESCSSKLPTIASILAPEGVDGYPQFQFSRFVNRIVDKKKPITDRKFLRKVNRKVPKAEPMTTGNLADNENPKYAGEWSDAIAILKEQFAEEFSEPVPDVAAPTDHKIIAKILQNPQYTCEHLLSYQEFSHVLAFLLESNVIETFELDEGRLNEIIEEGSKQGTTTCLPDGLQQVATIEDLVCTLRAEQKKNTPKKKRTETEDSEEEEEELTAACDNDAQLILKAVAKLLERTTKGSVPAKGLNKGANLLSTRSSPNSIKKATREAFSRIAPASQLKGTPAGSARSSPATVPMNDLFSRITRNEPVTQTVIQLTPSNPERKRDNTAAGTINDGANGTGKGTPKKRKVTAGTSSPPRYPTRLSARIAAPENTETEENPGNTDDSAENEEEQGDTTSNSDTKDSHDDSNEDDEEAEE